MRTVALWAGILIVIVVLFVGFLRWRQPPPARTPLTTTSLEEEAGVVSPLEQEVPVTPASTGTATPSPSPTTTPISTGQSISITDTGFSPATLTVPANTTVTFTNNGQGNHWPASVPHPVHTALVGFDAERALSTGETYSFTFTQPGTWGFHDHLNPLRLGSVVVQ